MNKRDTPTYILENICGGIFMKKAAFLILVFVFAVSLFSCKKEEGRVFDYQDDLRSVRGTFSAGDEKSEMALYFEKTEEGRRCRRIEYLSPDSLSGISYTLEGDKITAELDGIRIAFSYFSAEKVFALSRLFLLCEEDIYEIKSSENKTTTVYGKNGASAWEVVTSKEGIPVRITYEDGELSGIFTVSKIEKSAEKSEG